MPVLGHWRVGLGFKPFVHFGMAIGKTGLEMQVRLLTASFSGFREQLNR
jgi:hypothetical protein